LSEKSSEKLIVPPLHAPAEQPHVASLPHLIPQPPQLAGFVEMLVSQPFAPALSQSPRPAAHATHIPPEQNCDAEHVIPQPPQLFPLFEVFVSQPFAMFPSQSADPMGHASVHVPLTQILPALQGELHPPQCWPDELVLTSHPLARLPSQFAKPGLQPPKVHTPPGHASLAFTKSHGTPQPPQLATVVVLVSQPLFGFASQLAKPAAQFGAQRPAAHAVVPFGFEQATPQPPQFESVLRGVSQPFAGLRSQSAKPALHDPSTHEPFWHEADAFAKEHALLQMPQCVRLVFVFVSQPLFGFESQLAKPAAHMGEHAPPWHEVVPFALVQARPHEPQLVRLVAVLVSHPFAYWPSQLA
jgi:hypothetical protein